MESAVDMRVSRRGRPSLARASAIDDGIIASARSMFLAYGFDAVAMEQVAATVGISKATLYGRYPSKESLFVAVIETAIKQWSDESTQRNYRMTDDIEQRLRFHALNIADWLQRPDVLEFQHLVLSVRRRFPALAEAMREKGYVYIVDVITADIEAAAIRDGKPVNDAPAVARLLVAGLSGYQIQQDDGSATGVDIEGFAQRVVDILMAGRNGW